ncbi:30S ribosomal protein S8 [bacterium]|nr:30S ribosomal protein S8 [Candidatus Brocadiia bacterium]NQT50797.1 30S ribosomal protein S8 [bacterium]
MMTDPIADMLTRIRNALNIGRRTVTVRASKVNLGIARVLKDEGYIENYQRMETDAQGDIRVYLKYGPEGEKIVTELKRESKPSRRVYRGVKDIPRVLNGFGIAVVSTPKGILSDRECRRENVGGELICTVS